MRKSLSLLSVGVILVFAIYIAAVAVRWQFFIQEPMNLPKDGITYEYLPGKSVSYLANDLVAKGYLSSAKFFVWLVKVKGQGKTLQAGEYFFPKGTTPSGLVKKLSAGEIVQHPIRFGEGWTFKQIRQVLNDSKVLKHTIDDATDNEVMQRLKAKHGNPEGLFYPDTYYVAKNTKDITVLSRAYRRMQQLLDKGWESRSVALPYQSPYEALILASIIEKETALDNERQQIAGVLVNRLNKNMRLQADPTVIFGLGDAFDGDLTKADLQQYTPYNTYRIKGLPITPIALPSEASVLAALNPSKEGYLYFVATGDGGHYFSKTLKEHNRAVRNLINKQANKKKTTLKQDG